ncbi:phage tail tape measure protein [Aeromonas salmonicida]|nr:phage tail tape measure protein [Aeromonas salmonicida]
MRIALVDAITRPLAGINNQLKTVKTTAQSGFASIAGGGAAMLAGGMAIQNALMPAIEMDRALGEVASLDVAQSGLKALSDEALKFSVEYGKSATEFVRASYDIQSAIGGLSESELPAFTRASAVLAAATKADTGTITSYMGTMYGIFEQQAVAMGKADWVEAVAGKTATAVQMFKTTGQGMADAFQGVQSTATSLGVSMDEQFAVLGMLQSTMGGAVAGTAYKSFLSAIPKAGKGLGLSFYDASGAMLPMVDILEQIKGKFGDLEGEDIGKISAAFGETATPVILNLLKKTDQLKGNINALGNTTGMGKAEKMAADMTDQWQRVESAWFAIRAAAFGAVLPSINKVVGAFADGGAVVLRWTRLFPHLTKVISYAMLAIAGLGIVTGAWLVLAGLAKLVTLAWMLAINVLITPITLLRKALAVLRGTIMAVSVAMGLNPAVVIIGGILALIAVVALASIYWDELCAAFAVLTNFELLSAFFSGLVETFGPLASQVLAPMANIFNLIVGLLGQGIAWLGTFFEQTNQASVGVDSVTDAGRRMGNILGAVFDTLLTPWRALIKLIKIALDASNQFLGTEFDTSALNVDVLPKWAASPSLIAPPAPVVNSPSPITVPAMPGGMNFQEPEQQQEKVNAPLARYRQQDQSKVPSGGLGKQLIQANAAATSANQKPSKSLTTGDVYMNVQNPLSPGELEQEMWMTIRG